MLVLNCRNVNDALRAGLRLLRTHGIEEPSRNGPVLRVPVPVTTVYSHPCERVLLHSWRDANPFFHAIEAAWMLAGRNDLKQLTPYVARMKDFSDDGGKTQPGAYGRRWRHWFFDKEGGLHDQLDWVVERLTENTADRRTVIQMWDPNQDIWATDNGGADVPCNLTMLPYVSGSALHLTIFCRSGDGIWGTWGANAVHMSVAQEYIAGRIGLPVGTMTHIVNNQHGYLGTLPEGTPWADEWVDPYTLGTAVRPYGLFSNWGDQHKGNASAGNDEWRERICQEDLKVFFEYGAAEAATKARWSWVKQVLVPLALAHQHWRGHKGEGRYLGALEILERCAAADWRIAATMWIEKRRRAWERASDDGPVPADEKGDLPLGGAMEDQA